MNEIATKAVSAVSRIARRISPHAPGILLGVGVAAVAAGSALLVKKTLDIAPRVQEIKDEGEEVKRQLSDGDVTEEFAKEAARDRLLAYLKEGARLLPAAASVAGGIVCVVCAHNIQAGRIAAVSAAYNTLLASFGRYREKVIAESGEEKDREYLHGSREAEVEVSATGKDGKERRKRKTISLPGTEAEDLYHRCFDPDSTRECTTDPVYNFDFLKMQERIANDKFAAYGYLFLDEVYELLGFPLEGGYSKAKMVGWVKGEGDDYIDFGIYDPTCNKEGSYNFVKGYEPAIWLDFNCDGVIIDKI